MISNKPISKRGKAWPLHTPGRKETANVAPKNRPVLLAPGESVVIGYILMPLKRKYLTNRAYLQAPVGSPAQAKRANKRSHFPMSRNRAIPSPLAEFTR